MRNLRIVLHLVIGVAALGAGQALIRDTSGRSMTFETEWLKGSPFRDYLVPGLFLFFVNGGLNLAAAAGLWRRKGWGETASFAAGLVLVAWIAVQWATIGYRHWTQWAWSALFPAMFLLAIPGRGWRRPS